MDLCLCKIKKKKATKQKKTKTTTTVSLKGVLTAISTNNFSSARLGLLIACALTNESTSSRAILTSVS